MATGPGTYRRAVAGWIRGYAAAPRYRPEERITLRTTDGVTLGGARLAGPPGACLTVVLVHGLLHWSRTPRVHAFAHELARRVNVVVPELRGHGTSEGVCTLGRDEPLDVAAAVAAAPAGSPVVTVGMSLGGAAALLHAGTLRGVAGVVAISAPSGWAQDPADGEGAGRVRRWAGSPGGRAVLARLVRTRISPVCQGWPDSERIVGQIAPAFTIIAHDPDDHYFGEAHARRLYGWAREPKELWLLPGTGHGSDLLTPAFAGRLVDDLERRILGAAS
ncbi:MAG: alpha/beta fold hydrolase [Acidimicrobiales bacterium]